VFGDFARCQFAVAHEAHDAGSLGFGQGAQDRVGGHG
jgi:hypothetical protein